MRWSILLTTLVLTGCFDPNDPTGSQLPLGSGSSSSSSGEGSAGASTTSEGTTPTDPTTPSSTTGVTDPTDPSGETDTPAECTCAIAAPNNWTGPVVVARGDEIPDCVGAFTGSQLDAFLDIAGEAASCECTCGAAEMDCGDLNLLYRQSCGQPIVAEFFTEPDTCHDNTPAQNSTNPFFNPIKGTEACPPNPVVDVPPLTSTSVRMCGGTFEQAECGPGEQCIAAVPEAFEQRLCIARSGVHDCPPAYPEQEIVFGDIDDSRGCTDCNCAPEGAFECASTLQLYSGDKCGELTGTTDTDTCVASWGSFEFETPQVTGACSPSAPEAAGEVAGAEPTTLCCD